ncbi:MAG: diguanylate cyclase [Rhodanobacteraceae bacterium]|nr:diguanylate cyclase [Rhodanobacteraceae bacterium]MBL0040355.1 diguanylate cyclase [Xanthomonadales bacterium]MBP6078636.1 diguanylate cyclase [Xanthomonadales bacterium]MBP7623274.1 diguanylate cyclase [Xanthomonadales bacterium]
MRRAAWFLLACILLLPIGRARALDLVGDERDLRMGQVATVLHDVDSRWNLQDVIARTAEFAPPRDHPDLSFGYSTDTIWMRLPVQSRATGEQAWRIEFEYATVDRIDAYFVSARGTDHQQSGDRVPFAARSYPHRNAVFTLRLKPGERGVLYLRASSLGTMTLSSAIWSEQAFRAHSEAQYTANALYVGAALALALYNLLLFAVLRERSILLYVAFVLCFATAVAAMTGLGAQFLWPNAVDLGNRMLGIGFAASSLLAAIYARVYLDTARHAPHWHRVLGVLSGAHAVVLVVAMVGPIRPAFQLMSAGGVLNAILIFSCGLVCAWRGVPGARILVLAWFALLFGALLTSLRNFGLIPNNLLTANAMPIGSGLEMLLLSFGLAARFNELKRQKSEAQALLLESQQAALRQVREHESALERHVAERTEQLEAANVRLRELALHDPLTGLANRTALDAHFTAAFAQRRDHLRVLLIDLDGFKHVNDRYGHGIGDRVLAQIAQRIRDCVGHDDIAARLGGDEFVVVTPDARSEIAVRVLSDRIRDAVAVPITLDDGVVRITASIGVAGLDTDTADARDLLMRADRAMYAAKVSGGDRVHWAEH